MNRLRRGVAGIVGSLALAAHVAAAQDQPAFQITAEAVRLDVRVLDVRGRFVRGLTRDDFRVFDEEIPQTIAQTVLVDRPRASAPAARSDIRADAASNRTFGDGRIYALLLDDMHIAPARLPTARLIARQFIEQYLEETDRLAITTTSGAGSVVHEFSNDKASLIEAVDQLWSSYMAVDAAQTVRSMQAFVKFLATIPDRRKSIIFVSEGFGGGSGEIIRASTPANITFYPIDPRGNPGGAYTSIRPAPDERDRLTPQQMAAHRTLQALADETGGAALLNSNRFGEALARIADDSSTYYLLGYTPAPGTPVRKQHRVRVEVAGSGLTVSSRRGYAIPDLSTSVPSQPGTMKKVLEEAVESPLPLSGLSIDLATAITRGGAKARVGVVVDVEDDRAGELELRVVAFHEQQIARPGADEHARITVQPLAGGTGYRGRAVTVLSLPPGRYHLRVAAARHDRSARGSALHDLIVPDLQHGSLILSGLMLWPEAPGPLASTASPRLGSAAEPAASPQRVFTSGESLAIAAEVYGDSKTPKPLRVRAFLSAAEGGIRRQSDGAYTLPAGRRSRLPVSALLPLTGLEPGAYVIDLEVSGPERFETIVRRVPIAIH